MMSLQQWLTLLVLCFRRTSWRRTFATFATTLVCDSGNPIQPIVALPQARRMVSHRMTLSREPALPPTFSSESAVQPALAQLAAVPSAVLEAAGEGEDHEVFGDRPLPDPGAAFFPMPCDGAELLRASCSSAPPTRAQCTHQL